MLAQERQAIGCEIMLELLKRARWDQALDFLNSGDPPMIFRILAINTIFIVLFMIRKSRSPDQLRETTLMWVQGLLIIANVLILFQRDIQGFLNRFI